MRNFCGQAGTSAGRKYMNKQLCRPWVIAVLTVLLVVLDQWTKYLAVLFLKDQDPFVIIDGVFELHYLENRGAAFGIMQGQQVFFLVIALVVLLAVVYLFCKMSKDAKFVPLRLIRAVEGDVENGLIFCGDNVQYLDHIGTVEEVVHALFPER